MARGIQLHCNRHMAIDVPVCVDWFLTCQRDKMSFLERSQRLGAFQNCFRVRSKHTRNSEREEEQRRCRADGEGERVCGKKSIEGLPPHACTILSPVLLISSMRNPALFKDLRPFPPKQVPWNHAPFNTSDVLGVKDCFGVKLTRKD